MPDDDLDREYAEDRAEDDTTSPTDLPAATDPADAQPDQGDAGPASVKGLS